MYRTFIFTFRSRHFHCLYQNFKYSKFHSDDFDKKLIFVMCQNTFTKCGDQTLIKSNKWSKHCLRSSYKTQGNRSLADLDQICERINYTEGGITGEMFTVLSSACILHWMQLLVCDIFHPVWLAWLLVVYVFSKLPRWTHKRNSLATWKAEKLFMKM